MELRPGLFAAVSRALLIAALLVPARAALAADRMRIDDFEADKEGLFPPSWSARREFFGGCSRADKVITVRSDNGNRYLAVDSNNDSCTAAKEFHYDLSHYRFLTWRWRARLLPAKGDEASKKTNDSAAGLYVCFRGFARLPYCIKYVWSSTEPVGKVLDSPHRKATKIVVVRSGAENLGVWLQEKRNVYEDYQNVFGTKAVKDPVGIAVLTDSDDTRSRAAADYDDIAVASE
jgi:hypothetical protein